MCNCHSYNWDIGDIPEVILEAPEWTSKESICVDACIADVIKYLWDNGVITRGACCGHNKENPSLGLKQNTTKEEAARVRRLIEEVDDRKWVIFAWCIVEF